MFRFGARFVNKAIYNEIIVDGKYWTKHLPSTIEAFFYPSGSADHTAGQQHSAFLRKFRLRADAVPLLRLTPDDWSNPFSQG